MKIHKARSYKEDWPLCNIVIDNYDAKFVERWSRVTCKRCLARRPKKKCGH